MPQHLGRRLLWDMIVWVRSLHIMLYGLPHYANRNCKVALAVAGWAGWLRWILAVHIGETCEVKYGSVIRSDIDWDDQGSVNVTCVSWISPGAVACVIRVEWWNVGWDNWAEGGGKEQMSMGWDGWGLEGGSQEKPPATCGWTAIPSVWDQLVKEQWN